MDIRRKNLSISKGIAIVGFLLCCLSLISCTTTSSRPEISNIPTSKPVISKPTDSQPNGRISSTSNVCTGSDFPVPNNSSILFDFDGESCLIQSSLSYDEIETFYRNWFSAKEYTEIECPPNLNVPVDDRGICLVFSGHKSGKEIIIGMIKDPKINLVNIHIRLQ